MTFLKLGFRSLFRQKRRTYITLVVITFGIGCLLLTVSHSHYINWGLQEWTIHSETGHLQLFHKYYFDKEEITALQYGVDDFEQIRRDLSGLDEVKLVLGRIDLMGLISNGDKSVACIGKGVEPRLEKRLRQLFSDSGSTEDALGYQEYEKLIAEDSEGDIIVLGKGLAKSLNAKNGEWLTLLATTTDGALNAIDLKMVGAFTGYSPEYDERAIIIPLKSAQMLLNTQKVTHVLVTLDDTKKTDDLHEKINRLTKERGYSLVVKKWQDQALYYRRVKQFYNNITGFLSVVLFIIVFFSTSNTIVMSIVERTTEIGTLLSLGTSRWQTLKLFFFEGLFLGVMGGILSAIFAFGISNLINYFHIMLPPPPGLTEAYPLMLRNAQGFYIQIFIVTILVAMISSILPAFRATRMKIVDALGHI